jgi:hypothetical protein
MCGKAYLLERCFILRYILGSHPPRESHMSPLLNRVFFRHFDLNRTFYAILLLVRDISVKGGHMYRDTFFQYRSNTRGQISRQGLPYSIFFEKACLWRWYRWHRPLVAWLPELRFLERAVENKDNRSPLHGFDGACNIGFPLTQFLDIVNDRGGWRRAC